MFKLIEVLGSNNCICKNKMLMSVFFRSPPGLLVDQMAGADTLHLSSSPPVEQMADDDDDRRYICSPPSGRADGR